ncbi:hypothetical protein COCSUDRAFT_33891, partial [Coccomyxa subellipsoidea C-169]
MCTPHSTNSWATGLNRHDHSVMQRWPNAKNTYCNDMQQPPHQVIKCLCTFRCLQLSCQPNHSYRCTI